MNLVTRPMVMWYGPNDRIFPVFYRIFPREKSGKFEGKIWLAHTALSAYRRQAIGVFGPVPPRHHEREARAAAVGGVPQI